MLTLTNNTLRKPFGTPSGRQRGLTMVEMLVVMGICLMLGLLLVPIVFRSRERARQTVCKGNLNNLGQTFAVCLMENNNYLPTVYYSIQESDETSLITLRSATEDVPDVLFENGHNEGLTCPSDDRPEEVLARAVNGMAVPLGASYAYNISLPLAFRAATRVPQPMNTVTFYDGDPGSVVGEWELRAGWAEHTIRKRHLGSANYLFLDGHVETTEGFPDSAFDGGDSLLALGGQSAGLGNDSEWEGGGNSGDDGDTGGTDDDDGSIDFDVIDGTVVPNEPCTVTITCLGAAFQYGVGGPRIPVKAYYRIDGGSKTTITTDVQGGEQVVLEDFDATDAISIVGKTTKYFNSYYESDDGSGHCWAKRDNEVVPSIAGFDGQAPIESFLAPYMTSDGRLTLGQNDVIFLFELSNQIDYTRYSCADFQDLVVLVSLSNGSGGATGADSEPDSDRLGGSININPGNNPNSEFTLRLPDGFEITRDDLHGDVPLAHGSGFSADYLEYAGPATLVMVKPKGNGNQNGLTLDGEPYRLLNKNRYTITSTSMTVHLYNDKRNRRGRAMGKWWIDIAADDATITIVK